MATCGVSMATKYKDSQSRWFTIGLFKEFSGNKDTVLFTTEEARQLYLSCDDITGYTFANEHLGGWKHWLALHTSPKIEPLIKEWEEELEVRKKSNALRSIETIAKGEKGYQAAKFLVDGGWKEKKVGRTTKEAIKKAARVESKIYDEFKGSITKIK